MRIEESKPLPGREVLANEIQEKGALAGSGLPGDVEVPAPFLLVEHYPDAGCRRDALAAEHFDRVTFGYPGTERPVLRGTYRGLEVLTMPPPSSGGATLLQELNILEGFELGAMPEGGAVETKGASLWFNGCDSLTLLIAASTDYRMDNAAHYRGELPLRAE